MRWRRRSRGCPRRVPAASCFCSSGLKLLPARRLPDTRLISARVIRASPCATWSSSGKPNVTAPITSASVNRAGSDVINRSLPSIGTMSRRDSPPAAPRIAAVRAGRHRETFRPSWCGDWRPVGRSTRWRTRVEALAIAVRHLGQRCDVACHGGTEHHRAENRQLDDQSRLLCGERRPIVDQPVERRSRSLEVVRGASDGATRGHARRRDHDRRHRQRDKKEDARSDARFHPIVPADFLPNR